jgi:hypothetical protein
MRRIALLSLILLSSLAASAAPPVTREQALSNWLNAVGGRERLAAIKATVREAFISSGGEEGTAKTWSLADGRYRTDALIAGVDSAELFDGRDGWTIANDAPAHRAGPTDRERLVTEAWLEANAQWFPKRRGGTVVLESASDDEVVLVARPEGGREARIVLDRATWLPKRYVQRVDERMETVTVLAWETVGGVKLAKELVSGRGDPKYDTQIRFTKTTFDPKIPASVLAPPDPASFGTKFRNGVKETVVPFELAQNHIHFPITVNGHATTALFDTGADFTAIDAGVAKGFGLTGKGAFEVRGSGPESAETSIIAKPVLTIGEVEFPLQFAATLSLGALSLREGRPLNGIVGYNVISRFVVEVDYVKQELRFRDPAKWTAPKGATALPFYFRGNTPITEVKVTDRSGHSATARLLIDTGARGAVDLSKPFLTAHKIEPGPALEGPLGAGIGGATSQLVGRLASIELAGVTIPLPVTAFSTATGGSDTNPDVDGILGDEVLRRFDVTIDYPHERLLLRKNSHFTQPFEYDMSGLLLVAVDAKFDRVLVKNVLPSSPAAEAGLAAKDEIVSIDGKPAAAMPLDALRALLRQEGKTYALRVRRGSEEKEVTLTTRRLV